MDSTILPTSEAEAVASIIEWSTGCPPWQRDALRRLFTKAILDSKDYEELYNLCLGQGVVEAAPLTEAHARLQSKGATAISLKAIKSVQHVNALAPDECLSFDKTGLTIVYGDNGAGKSGYARILKAACRARSPKNDMVLPSIYSQNPGSPSAKLEYFYGDQKKEAHWESNAPTDGLLSAISVFDSRTASVHVNQENNVAYTPFPLRMLEALVHICNEIRKKIETEIKTIEEQKPQVLREPECKPNSSVGQLLGKLNSQDAKEQVEALACITESDAARFEKLKNDLSGDPAVAASQLTKLKVEIEGIVSKIRTISNILNMNSIQVLSDATTNYLKAKKASKAASDFLFSSDPLPDAGSDVWRTLWESARKYSQKSAYPGLAFPVISEGARCVLCQQELSSDAANRMQRFEAFVIDDSKTQEELAQKVFQDCSQSFSKEWLTNAQRKMIYQVIEFQLKDIGLYKSIKKYIVQSMWELRNIMRKSSEHSIEFEVYHFDSTSLIDQLVGHCQSLEQRANSLRAEIKSPERQRLLAEFDELTARQWLSIVKNDVLAQIQRENRVALLKNAIKNTATNSVTIKSKNVATALVTNALRAQFTTEVARIGISSIAIELRQDVASKGVPLFRISLINKPSESVGNILSEGEHRCIAIAAFLAELISIESKSAIVFDDPVSSLDHIYREKIAQRLAEAGADRQVIIFTHDLAFLFLLWSACKEINTPVAFRSISRSPKYAGHCNPNPPPSAQPVPEVIKKMTNHLNNIRIKYDSGDQEQWYYEVRSFQEKLRTTWERAVEDTVAPVVKRFSNQVDTKRLHELTVITLDDYRTMRESYGRCSALLHSESERLNTSLPTPEHIHAEIESLKNWYEDVRGRQQQLARGNN